MKTIWIVGLKSKDGSDAIPIAYYANKAAADAHMTLFRSPERRRALTLLDATPYVGTVALKDAVGDDTEEP